MFSLGEYSFIYDADKGMKNKRKHGLSFETAAHVFQDRLRLDFPDDAHSTIDEERWITIGLVQEVLTVVYCERETDGVEYFRLISARPASPEERTLYNNNIFGRR